MLLYALYILGTPYALYTHTCTIPYAPVTPHHFKKQEKLTWGVLHSHQKKNAVALVAAHPAQTSRGEARSVCIAFFFQRKIGGEKK